MRLIDADELKKAFALLMWREHNPYDTVKACDFVNQTLDFVDNAPTVERPTGEREFIEIIAHYVPDDICTYPEYRGKPYYEIRYKENGEEHIGYGTYNLKVLSEFLRDYFLCI